MPLALTVRDTTYSLSLVTAPAEEPVSLTEAKKQVEVASAITAHDAHLTRLIVAARQRAEALTGRQIVTAAWKLFRDEFPSQFEPIRVPKAPLASVVHLKYTSTAGTLTTWDGANYQVLAHREPAEIWPAYGVVWPTPRCQAAAVEVQFSAGYGAAASCPELLKAAMLMMVADWWTNRLGENEVSRAVIDLLESYRFGDDFCHYGS